jgi:hypothetical protein
MFWQADGEIYDNLELIILIRHDQYAAYYFNSRMIAKFIITALLFLHY